MMNKQGKQGRNKSLKALNKLQQQIVATGKPGRLNSRIDYP